MPQTHSDAYLDLHETMQERWILHTSALLNSFRQRTGRDLLPRSGEPEEEARRLFAAPFVVVSHGVEPDPVLNYGNGAALALWETTAEQFLATPSRLTAEPMLREERERMLAQAARDGFFAGYEGVRISSAGRRFRIFDGTIWNLSDADGRDIGQAATFARWEHLP